MAIKKFLRSCCVGLLIMSFATVSFAQQAQEEVTTKTGPRKQLATIIFAGLGGAVLGLSTLSFYGRPQERLANIAIGFAVGVIIGTIYVTYQTATKPKEYYGTSLDDKLNPTRQDLIESQTASTGTLGLNFKF